MDTYIKLLVLKNGFDVILNLKDKSSILKASFPNSEGSIKAVLSKNFDICFKLPELVEVECNINQKTKTTFLNVISFNELFYEMKKILIEMYAEDIEYIFEDNHISPGFIFKGNGKDFKFTFSFINGEIKTLIL